MKELNMICIDNDEAPFLEVGERYIGRNSDGDMIEAWLLDGSGYYDVALDRFKIIEN